MKVKEAHILFGTQGSKRQLTEANPRLCPRAEQRSSGGLSQGLGLIQLRDAHFASKSVATFASLG